MRTGLRSLVAAAILVLSFTAVTSAQYTGAIRGVVKDSSGRPTPGAVVTIMQPETPTIRVAVTDLHGKYVIDGLEPGAAYVVHVTHPNFRKQRLQSQAYATVQDRMTVLLKPRRSTMVAER